MMQLIKKETGKLINKIKVIARRGIIKAISTDLLAQIQGYYDADVNQDVAIFQHFGFISVPPAGTNVVTIAPGGSEEGQICIAEADNENRPLCNEGTTIIYGTKSSSGNQASIICSGNGGGVSITPGGLNYVTIGGVTPTYKVLRGETVRAAIYAFATSVAAATTVAQIAAAAATLLSDMGTFTWYSDNVRIEK